MGGGGRGEGGGGGRQRGWGGSRTSQAGYQTGKTGGYSRLPTLQGEVKKGPREEIYYFGQGGELNAVRWNDWKVHFAVQHGNIATAVRDVTGWPTIMNLRADPYEKAPYESGMYIRWYADNIWLFVTVQQKLKDFLGTLPEFPFQEGSSLNAANINYTTLKAAAALKRLKELESSRRPASEIRGGHEKGEGHTIRPRASSIRPSARARRLARLGRAGDRPDRPAAVMERRAGQEGDRRVRAGHHRQGESEVRVARGAHRDVRPGRDPVGVHPMYTQVVYCLERVPAVVAKKPELKNVEPFKTVLSGNREAMAKLSMKDLEKILAATLTGMTVEEFNAEVKKWLATAKHPRWKRPYTELTYQPMLEVLQLPARERLQDLHRDRRRPGLRARVRRAGLRHPARAGGRHGRGRPSTATPRTDGRCSPRNRSSS